MKKLTYLILVLLISGCSGNSNGSLAERGDLKFKEISKIKEGFKVTHNPSEVGAILNGPSGRKYTWVYKTTVESIEKISIVEFGAFVEINNKWIFSTYTGKPFTQDDFAEWYGCPDGALFPNVKYTDPSNWSGFDRLTKKEDLWYYIGKTESGELVKAIGKVVSLAEMEK